MKRILSGRTFIVLLFLLLLYSGMQRLMAQAPYQFNYQGAARKPNGQPLSDTEIQLRLSILDGTANGPVVYSERRKVVTSKLGLYQVQIGSDPAATLTGKLQDVAWGTGPKYLKIELDLHATGNFETAGTSQLLSVPYALFAASSQGSGTSGAASGDLSGTYPGPKVTGLNGRPIRENTLAKGQVLQFDGEQWVAQELKQPWHGVSSGKPAAQNTEAIYQQASVGILTTSPVAPLDVRGAVRFGQPADGSIGAMSAAFGNQNQASGSYAAAFGSNNMASGSRSTVFGTLSEVSGHYSTSFGSSNKVSGWMSTAIGGNLEAKGNFQSIFGTNNFQGNAGDILLQVGNGNPNVPSERSNAITVTTGGSTLLGTSRGMPNSTLQVAGTFSLPIRSIIDGSPGEQDYTLLVRGSISMPAASEANRGRMYQLVNDSEYTHQVRGEFRLNGRTEPGLLLDVNDGHRGVAVQSDGKEWVVLNQF